MKLFIRTIKNQSIEVEIDSTATISNLQHLIEQQIPNLIASQQTLIHAGKILSPELSLSDYPAIVDSQTLVVLANRTTPKKVAEKDESSKEETKSKETDGKVSASTAEAQKDDQSPPLANTSSEYGQAASTLLTGNKLNETIASIVAMGFSPEQVQAAMQRAFNNPDRAVEYLTSGFPPEETSEETQPEPPTNSEANPLDALRRHPQFHRIRSMIRTNPAMLGQVIDLIGQSNPQLFAAINENPQGFMEILREADNTPEDSNPNRGGVVTIPMTAAELQALERLEGLGFPRQAVQEAYLACDRNEELAANYLFENSDELLEENIGE